MIANLHNITVQSLQHFPSAAIHADVLRLDLFHPVVSGNKWFKLRYYLSEAGKKKQKKIVTYGGPYSNHIVAAAFAAREYGLESKGYIRGEEPTALSHTLLEAKDLGMELVFIPREKFAAVKREIVPADENIAQIPEGGYGITGALGAATILDTVDAKNYTHILCACGTGTMLAGLIKAAPSACQVIGVSVLKNQQSLEEEVNVLLEEMAVDKAFEIWHGFHFGGYAKHTEALLDFMRALWEKESLPTDFVYTGKLFYAVYENAERQFFPGGSRLLIIHSGGLQGNLSLPGNALPY